MSVNGSQSDHGQEGRPAASERTPAPAWARSDRPLRIAIIGWARLSEQAWEGSGYNLVASELARGLAMSGHEVSYLAAGRLYRLFRKTGIVHREDWGGVRCYELINGPNLAPAAFNFKNMRTEIDCPAQTQHVLAWLDSISAQAVHVHSAEGFSLDMIRAIEQSGRPVMVTPHNYWFVCPQVDLLHSETRVCMDYDGGRRCVGCLQAEDASERIRKRKFGQSLEKLVGMEPANTMRGLAYGVPRSIGRLFSPSAWRLWNPPVGNPDRLADTEAALGFDGVRADEQLEQDGQIDHDWSFSPTPPPRPYDAADEDTNERFLRADHHLTVLNEYGERRVAGVSSLNDATLVTPPSDFLRKVHVEMGVEEARTRWVRLGLPHFDQINRRARRSPYYETRPWSPQESTRPLRFAFLGTTRPNKGLEVLADAIPMLSRDTRQHCQFLIRAAGDDWSVRKRLSRFPEVSVWGAFDRFQLIASAGEYDVAIIPHIWFENSPLVLLENLHAGKFVVCSRLGGPVDWLDPPKNGLFFAGGEPADLAERIRSLVAGEVTIPSAREVHEATVLRSFPDYVRENESMYRTMIDPASAAASVVVTAGHGADAPAT